MLLKAQRPEDLLHLTAHGHIVLIGQVLDELLGDGGAAEGGPAAQEHIGAGLHRSDPVHALVLEEPLVLDGHRRVHQILGNLVVGNPDPVDAGVDLLQLHHLVVLVHIVDERGLVQVDVFQGVVGIGDHILLQIVAQVAGEHHAGDEHHRQGDQHRPQSQLHRRKAHGEDALHHPHPEREPVVFLSPLPE